MVGSSWVVGGRRAATPATPALLEEAGEEKAHLLSWSGWNRGQWNRNQENRIVMEVLASVAGCLS